MKSIICFCSEGLVMDKKTNNISAFNILEKISSHGFPLFFQKIFFFARLDRKESEPPKKTFDLKVFNNSEELLTSKVSVNFNDKLITRQIVEILGIAIKQPGELKFNLFDGEKEFCSYSINIEQTENPKVKSVLK